MFTDFIQKIFIFLGNISTVFQPSELFSVLPQLHLTESSYKFIEVAIEIYVLNILNKFVFERLFPTPQCVHALEAKNLQLANEAHK